MAARGQGNTRGLLGRAGGCGSASTIFRVLILTFPLAMCASGRNHPTLRRVERYDPLRHRQCAPEHTATPLAVPPWLAVAYA